VDEFLSGSSCSERSRLPAPMPFITAVEKPLVLDDCSAECSAKLIADQRILLTHGIREKVIRRKGLHAVVFKQRTMKLIGARFEDGIGYKRTALAVFRRKRMRYDSILLDRFRRDGSDRSAALRAASALPLVIVIVAFQQEIPHAGTGSVHGGATRCTPKI